MLILDLPKKNNSLNFGLQEEVEESEAAPEPEKPAEEPAAEEEDVEVETE